MKTEKSKTPLPLVGEDWRVIASFPDYEASNLGRCRRIHTNRILRPFAGEYLRVSVKKRNGQAHTIEVHRLVVEAFHGPIPERMQVHHVNGDKYNNHLSNLRIVTGSENLAEAVRAGAIRSKLKPETIAPIRALLSAGVSDETIANAFCVRPTTIMSIRQGRSWRAISEQKEVGSQAAA